MPPRCVVIPERLDKSCEHQQSDGLGQGLVLEPKPTPQLADTLRLKRALPLAPEGGERVGAPLLHHGAVLPLAAQQGSKLGALQTSGHAHRQRSRLGRPDLPSTTPRGWSRALFSVAHQSYASRFQQPTREGRVTYSRRSNHRTLSGLALREAQAFLLGESLIAGAVRAHP